MKSYIYTLSDPRNGNVRYVGKTINPRMRYGTHIVNHEHSEGGAKRAWISDLKSSGLAPQMIIIEEVEGRENAADRELFWVEKYLSDGCELVNRKRPKAKKPYWPYKKTWTEPQEGQAA